MRDTIKVRDGYQVVKGRNIITGEECYRIDDGCSPSSLRRGDRRRLHYKSTEEGVNMEYRIRKCGHGGFTVEKGIAHKGGEHIHGMLGSTMPAFIVYESAHFDTKRQAQAYIRKH